MNRSGSEDQITFSYTFVDHFGTGVDNADSYTPGLSNMYDLQHNYGN